MLFLMFLWWDEVDDKVSQACLLVVLSVLAASSFKLS